MMYTLCAMMHASINCSVQYNTCICRRMKEGVEFLCKLFVLKNLFPSFQCRRWGGGRCGGASIETGKMPVSTEQYSTEQYRVQLLCLDDETFKRHKLLYIYTLRSTRHIK